MQQIRKPVSKTKVALAWLFMVGNLIFWIWFWFWRNRHEQPPTEDASPVIFASLFMVIAGMFFFALGMVGYLVVIFSDCFTFNFNKPIWGALKVKMYIANIVVPVLAMLGVGFFATAFLRPVLTSFGITGALANMLPLIAVLVLLQIAMLWVLIWAPLERRVITRRLMAQGITPAQLKEAVLVGISNPARSSFKKFGAVEEDIGAMWVSPEQIVYWGDNERFAIKREQLFQIERKADAGSSTLLSGMTHVILHVRTTEAERQIRLSPEGLWTALRKRRMMDEIERLIATWHNTPGAMPPVIPNVTTPSCQPEVSNPAG